MPDLESELRDALRDAADRVSAKDLRRSEPAPINHRRPAGRAWLVAASVAIVAALAVTLGVTQGWRHGSSVTGDQAAFAGSVWAITSVTYNGVATQVPPVSESPDFMPYTVYFLADGKWGAADQVNAYEGTYTVSGDDITVHDGAHQQAQVGSNDSTGQAVEGALLAASSGKPTTIRVASTRATMTVGAYRIELERPSATGSSLVGTQWRITDVYHDSQHLRMPGNAQFTVPTPEMTFARNGAVDLSDGSLSPTGRYLVRGTRLTISDIRMHPLANGGDDAAAIALNRALRQLETPASSATFAVGNTQLRVVTGAYTIVSSRIGSEPTPTPTPTFPMHTGATPGFVGYAWRITAVNHDGTKTRIPTSDQGSITFTTDGHIFTTVGSDDQGGTYQLTARGYVVRLLADNLMFAPRNATGPVLESGVHAITTSSTDITAAADGTELTVTAGGYVVTAERGARVGDLASLLPITDPTKLVGTTWTLTGVSEQPLQVGGRPTYQEPDAPVSIEFSGSAGTPQRVHFGCSTALASTGRGQIQFNTPWSKADGPTCAGSPALGSAQQAFALDLLSRSDFWEIKQGTLTIARAGVGTLRFGH